MVPASSGNTSATVEFHRSLPSSTSMAASSAVMAFVSEPR